MPHTTLQAFRKVVDLKHIHGANCNIGETQSRYHHGREEIQYGNLQKKDPIHTVETYDDVDDSCPSFSDSGTVGRKSSRRQSKHCHIKRKGRYVKRYCSLSKSSRDKYNSCSGSETEEENHLSRRQKALHSRERDPRTDSESSIDLHQRCIRRRSKTFLAIHPWIITFGKR